MPTSLTFDLFFPTTPPTDFSCKLQVEQGNNIYYKVYVT